MPASTEEARREGVAVLVTAAVLFGGLAAWRVAHALEPRATPAECAELRERYLAKTAAQLEPEANPTRRAELAASLAKRWTAAAECASSVSRSEVACALAADSTDDMERCFR